MSYDSLRVKVGRRPITIVEIDLDYCANTYGVAPCVASVPGTGAQKCFNTYVTCQDKAHFSKTVKTYKFCTAGALLPIGDTIFPCIKSVDVAPTQITPLGLSVSASVTVTLTDFPHHDRGIDAYVAGRTYSPEKQGTFFGKLRARNPYMFNRVMRVKEGYIDGDRQVFSQTKTYFIDRIEGPDSSGMVKLVGKGLMRFADDEKAVCPVATKASITNAISASATSFNITLQPSGIGNEQFAPNEIFGVASGYARIDDEILFYRSRSGDTLVVSTADRPKWGTVAAAHAAGAKIQSCRYYDGYADIYELPAILYNLLNQCAGIDSAYLPLTDWIAECAALSDSNLHQSRSLIISEPTPVKKLVAELAESIGAVVWYDEVDAKIKLKLLTADGTGIPVITEDQILAGSMSVKDVEKERYSRIAFFYQLIDWTSSPSNTNAQKKTLIIDADSEGVNAYAAASTLEIATRWINQNSAAQEIGSRLINVFKSTRRQITFKLDAKDAIHKTGDLVDIECRLIQSPDGSYNRLRFLIIEKQETAMGSQYQYKALQMVL